MKTKSISTKTIEWNAWRQTYREITKNSFIKLLSIFSETNAKSHRSFFGWRGSAYGGSSSTPTNTMATSSGILKDCTHITFNDTLKSHNTVTLKLVKTGKCETPIFLVFSISISTKWMNWWIDRELKRNRGRIMKNNKFNFSDRWKKAMNGLPILICVLDSKAPFPCPYLVCVCGSSLHGLI